MVCERSTVPRPVGRATAGVGSHPGADHHVGTFAVVSSRSLLAPRWIVSHVIVLAIVVTFPQLGMWQLDRWDEVRSDRANLESRLADEPVPLDAVLPDGAAAMPDLEFVRVTATGTWSTDETVAQRNRDLSNQAGFDLLTPLELGDGTAVLVRRGFVPPATPGSAEPLDPGPPRTGEVTVTGWLELPTSQPDFGPRDPAEGELDLTFYADVERIQQQVEPTLRPMLLHLQDVTPPTDAAYPVPQPAPDLEDTSNLSYAIQWFAFTAIALVGYLIVLWRRVRGRDVPTA